jgi:hypothetical protein
MATRKHNPQTYGSLDTFLGNKIRKKIENNTYVERINDTAIGIRLHQTYILTFHKGGQIMVKTGGWQTSTTKNRINQFMPDGVGIHQVKHKWLVSRYEGEGVHVALGEFKEEMIFCTIHFGRRIKAEPIIEVIPSFTSFKA